MSKYFYILAFIISLSVFSAAAAPAKPEGVNPPRHGQEVDIDENLLNAQPAESPSEDELNYNKTSEECYNFAEAKIKASGKLAQTKVSPNSPDPRGEALDSFYEDCMKQKGYAIEPAPSEGEEEE